MTPRNTISRTRKQNSLEEDEDDLRRLVEVVVLHPTLTHTPLILRLSEYPLLDVDWCKLVERYELCSSSDDIQLPSADPATADRIFTSFVAPSVRHPWPMNE